MLMPNPQYMKHRLQRIVSNYGLGVALRIIAHRLLLKPLIPLMQPLARRRLSRWISEADSNRVILIRSTLDLAYPYRQRVHHMALELARQGWREIGRAHV